MEKYDSFNKNIVKKDEDESIRPKVLNDYIGQDKIKEMLSIFIKASNDRGESLDHILLYGPPGLGKTTLANIIASEKHKNIKICSAPSLRRVGDICAVLSSLDEGDILFIDEIHRLNNKVMEILYSAMEDFYISVLIGREELSQNIKVNLPKFTLIGATTRFGDIIAPLRDRFGIICSLSYYNLEELSLIVNRTAGIFNTPITNDASLEIAKRSRGTPRVANRIFKRVRDYMDYLGENVISYDTVIKTLDLLNIDSDGFDSGDYKYLQILNNDFGGGPVGIDALSKSMCEERVTIEDVIEPFLLRNGYIIRSSRGRMITRKAKDKLGI